MHKHCPHPEPLVLPNPACRVSGGVFSAFPNPGVGRLCGAQGFLPLGSAATAHFQTKPNRDSKQPLHVARDMIFARCNWSCDTCAHIHKSAVYMCTRTNLPYIYVHTYLSLPCVSVHTLKHIIYMCTYSNLPNICAHMQACHIYVHTLKSSIYMCTLSSL